MSRFGRFRTGFVLALLGVCLALPSLCAADSPDAEREAAVALARDGELEFAVGMLDALLRDHPDDRQIRGDLAVVLEWAGQDRRAVEVADPLDPAGTPEYVNRSVALALESLGNPGRGFEHLRAAAHGTAASRLLKARLRAEAGQASEAITDLEALLEVHPSAEAWALLSRIHRRGGDYASALKAAEQARFMEPEDRAARRETVLATAGLEGSEAALELLEADPDALDADETFALRGDLAVHWIRRADAIEAVPLRQATTDRALDELGRLLDDLPAGHPAVERTRRDRVVALRQRERMEEAIEAYRTLLDEHGQAPVWVTEAAADAHLYLREPEEAADLYQQILEREPDRYNTRLALFYALIEAEEFSPALETIDRLADDHADEPRGVDAARQAAMARAWANRLDEAQSRLEALARHHPENLHITRDLATVYRWRGWPHRALATLEPVVETAGDAVAPRLAQASVLADLQRFRQAGALIEELKDEHPENRHVQRQHEEWRDRTRWQVSMSGEYGDSDGFREFGSRDRRLQARVAAPWIGASFQPWAVARYSDARFPEGETEYDRVGAGLSWRDRRRHAQVEVHRNRTGSAETGVTAGLDWHVGDHWSLATRYESFTEDVPLRARNQGIDGWKAEAAARWQAHESLGLRGGVSRLGISDGNVRWTGLLGLEHYLQRRAHHLTRGSLDLYGSRASQTGGPYFNPRRDASAGYTLEHDWVSWRRYTRSLTQRFVAGAGAYWQEGFATHAIGDLRYEHRWSLGRDWQLHYGVGVSSRVYDGDREQRVYGRFALEGRF